MIDAARETLSLKRSALIAAIGLTIARGHWSFRQFQLTFSMPDFRWTDVLLALFNAVFLIPLPVLLFILHRSGVALIVSNRLKYAALGVALTLAGLFTVPSISSWIRVVLFDWKQIQQYNGVTIAEKFGDWFSANHEHAIEGLWIAAGWLSEVALIVFLIALFRNNNDANDAGANPSGILRIAAASGVVLAASAAILTASKFIFVLLLRHSSKDPWSNLFQATPPLGQMMWQVSKLTIREVCLFVPA